MWRFGIFLSLVTLLFYYFARRVIGLLHLSHSPGRWVIWGLTVGLFVLIVVAQSLYRTGGSISDTSWKFGFSYAVFLLMGLWATIMCFLIPLDIFGFFAMRVWSPLMAPFQSPIFGVSFLSGCALLVVFGAFTTARGPQLYKVSLPVPSRFSPQEVQALSGLRVVQISDLHIGPTVVRKHVEKIVAQVNALEPDIVLITGDLIDGKVSQIAMHVAPLAGLKASRGVFYAVGNHEYYWGAQEWIDHVKTLGITPLVNQGQQFDVSGVKLWLGGVSDWESQQFIPEQVPDLAGLIRTAPSDALKMLMIHRPSHLDQVVAAGYDIVFSGHTHGGQFFPWSLYVPIAHRMYRGLYSLRGAQLYVNRGTGYWGPPLRLGVPEEITLFQFVPSRGASSGV